MRSFYSYTLLTIGLAFIFTLIFPWWSVAIAGFGVAFYWIESPAKAFFSGLIGVGMLWMVMAVFKDSGSSVSVAETLGNVVGGVPSYLMYFITGLTGGAVGGLGAMTGTYTRSILLKK